MIIRIVALGVKVVVIVAILIELMANDKDEDCACCVGQERNKQKSGAGQTKPTKVALGNKLAQSPALAKARA